MTRFVVDCGVVLLLAGEGIEVAAGHELLAPTLLRSQTLSALHEAVHRGEVAPDVALDRLARIRAMPIRLLGDAVLRRRAWDVAERLGWAETYDAEYVALTQLQADAFVTLDTELARRVEGIVPRRRSRRSELDAFVVPATWGCAAAASGRPGSGRTGSAPPGSRLTATRR
jgi:predicted nucleic acid-binding protein